MQEFLNEIMKMMVPEFIVILLIMFVVALISIRVRKVLNRNKKSKR